MRIYCIHMGWVLAAVAGLSANASASLYWNRGVRGKQISVCFVGDAVTSRPARVQQVMTYLKEYEYAVNVKFFLNGTCPAPTPQPNGNDFYAGDIRVVLPYTSVSGTGMVPGKGCQMFIENGKYNGKNDGWGSWSNSPDEAQTTTQCLYNLKLGDDPWNATPYLNHTLHEFGHALGLAHEHERTDVDKLICTADGFGGGASSGFLTPYDRYSVMHYMFASCGIKGNYDYTGLSTWDRLGVHILYPEDGNPAEYVGTIVVRTTESVHLTSAWKIRGANLDFAASNFEWIVDSAVASTSPDFVNTLPAGDHPFRFTHRDFLGRSYTYQGTINIMSPAAYNTWAAAIVVAAAPL